MKFILLASIFMASVSASLAQKIDLVRESRTVKSENDHSRTFDIFNSMATQNPYNGNYWFEKGVAAIYLEKFDIAIEALKKSIELGYGLKTSLFALGYSYALNQNFEAASVHFEKLAGMDPSWINIIEEQSSLVEFLSSDQANSLSWKKETAKLSRKEEWIKDIDFLFHKLQSTHPDLYGKNPKQKWEEQIRMLKSELEKLGDSEIYLEMMKLVAMAGDGHTNIWPVSDDQFTFKMLPLNIYFFDDGFHLAYVPETYKQYSGAEVLKIGKYTIQQVFDSIAVFEGHENLMHRKLLSTSLIAIVEILRHIGAIDNTEMIELEIKKEGKDTTIQVQSVALNYDITSTNHVNKNGAIPMNHTTNTPLPIWLKDPGNYYWYEILEQSRTLYFQYNAILEKSDAPFSKFCEEMFDDFLQKKLSTLVIDIRKNDGGSTTKYRPLIELLIKHRSSLDQVFVIIGRRTYSAAMNLAVDLEYWIDPFFIGEPTSSSPNFIGENKIFKLPYSDIQVSVSDRYHQRGDSNYTDRRVWIAPHIYVPFSASDFKSNIDPAMKLILDR